MGAGLKANPYLVRLCDCMGVNLKMKNSGLVLGNSPRVVDMGLGNTRLALNVTSSVVRSDFVALILHVSGSLYLTFALGPSTQGNPMIIVVDEGAVQFSMAGLLEHCQITGYNDLRAALGVSAVRTYRQTLSRWKQD